MSFGKNFGSSDSMTEQVQGCPKPAQGRFREEVPSHAKVLGPVFSAPMKPIQFSEKAMVQALSALSTM